MQPATTETIQEGKMHPMKGKQRLLVPTIIEQAIKWKHAVCGYPIKTTWSKAANAGNVVGWPLLTGK
jgi:hypothetical protein